MANTKKYVSLDKLSLYDEKLKELINSNDTTTLDSAKAYANSLASNYDAAGSAASVKSNLDAEVTRAKEKEDELLAANAETQREVDALETLVGTLPDTATATNIVGYVQEKTSGIATSENLAELTNRVVQAETDIDNIEKDYLKADDKTELSDAITAEASRADAAEKANAAAIKVISDDYLKAADKTELQGNINTVSTGLADVKADVDAFFADADMTESAKDTLKELQAYIASDETAASEMLASIQKNAQDISDEADKVATLQTEMDAVEQKATDNASAIAALQTAVGEGGSVDKKIEDAVSAETTARETAIAEVQADADKGIEDALAAAQAASAHADELNTAMSTRVKAVEDKAHEHSNKAELDLIVAGDKAKWDAAQANAEATAAAALATAVTTLEGKITAAQTAAEKVANDNNTAMDTRVTTLETWHNNFTEVSEDEINSLFVQ